MNPNENLQNPINTLEAITEFAKMYQNLGEFQTGELSEQLGHKGYTEYVDTYQHGKVITGSDHNRRVKRIFISVQGYPCLYHLIMPSMQTNIAEYLKENGYPEITTTGNASLINNLSSPRQIAQS
jgi:hypothetical protein